MTTGGSKENYKLFCVCLHTLRRSPPADTSTLAGSMKGRAAKTVRLSGQVCQWGVAGLLLNEVFPLVVSGRALRVRLAVEGKLVSVFGLSCFDFLVPVRLFPAADDPGSYGQHNHGNENCHCDHT